MLKRAKGTEFWSNLIKMANSHNWAWDLIETGKPNLHKFKPGEEKAHWLLRNFGHISKDKSPLSVTDPYSWWEPQISWGHTSILSMNSINVQSSVKFSFSALGIIYKKKSSYLKYWWEMSQSPASCSKALSNFKLMWIMVVLIWHS